MINTLQIISKTKMNSNYYQVEYCGSYDESLEEYYIVLAKSNLENFFNVMGADSDMARKDILNRLGNNQIKALILRGVDSVEDSIMGYLLDSLGDIDEVLEHYGIVTYEEEGIVESTVNLFDTIEVLDEEEYYEEPEPAKPVEKVIIPEPIVEQVPIPEPVVGKIEEEIPEPNLHDVTEEDYKEEKIGKKERAIHERALRNFAASLGRDFDNFLKEAEIEIESESNPYLAYDEVITAIDLLMRYRRMTKFEAEFMLSQYQEGSIENVTNFINGKLEELCGGTY